MQINFEPEKIKAAKAYVDRLNPIKIKKKEKAKINDFDTTKKEEKSSFLKSILKFFFK